MKQCKRGHEMINPIVNAYGFKTCRRCSYLRMARYRRAKRNWYRLVMLARFLNTLPIPLGVEIP